MVIFMYKYKGMTLSELLISITIFLMCSTVVLSTWIWIKNMYNVHIGSIDSRRELRAAFHSLNKDVINARAILTGKSFTIAGDPDTHTVPVPGGQGDCIVLAIPELTADGSLLNAPNNTFTVVGYYLARSDLNDSLNSDTMRLIRWSKTGCIPPVTNEPSSFTDANLTMFVSGSNSAVMIRYIQKSNGLSFTIYDPPNGIETIAIQVLRKVPHLPAIQLSMRTSYYLRNNFE